MTPALISIFAFLFASLLVAGVGFSLITRRQAEVGRRLRELNVVAVENEAAPSLQSAVSPASTMLKAIGQKALPRSPKELSALRLRLVRAGYRGNDAVAVFYGMRVVLAALGFLLTGTGLLGRPDLLLTLGAVGIGFVLPGVVLGRRVRRRQWRIRLALPDALDLLVVSVEAGLGLDQALLRVSDELAHAHPDIADELKLVNLELRAGKPRTEALRNLADRTGVDDMSALVSMLIQTDKFGTSIAQSLRVHSDTLRTKRRQRAEEAAAKTGVKMVFPLVFCIFPSIWVVTIGPAAIKFIKVLVPVLEGVGR